jgi:proteasome lid subunit RPN8/RPN11
MLTHVLACLPEEACGILSGTQDRVVVSVIPITNELHSPTAFQMAPIEQIQAFLQLEKNNLEMIAVYHSHPNGPAQPSESDIDQFRYPGVIQLIWSFQDSGSFGFTVEGSRIWGCHDTPKSGSSPQEFPKNQDSAWHLNGYIIETCLAREGTINLIDEA